MRTATAEFVVRAELIRRGPCTLQNLLDHLPQFSWCEVFAVIDRLSREGTLVLRRLRGCDYEVSVRSTSERSLERLVSVSGEGVLR